MRLDSTSDLISEAVLVCADNIKVQFTNEVDRLFEELQRNLLSRLEAAQAEGDEAQTSLSVEPQQHGVHKAFGTQVSPRFEEPLVDQQKVPENACKHSAPAHQQESHATKADIDDGTPRTDKSDLEQPDDAPENAAADPNLDEDSHQKGESSDAGIEKQALVTQSGVSTRMSDLWLSRQSSRASADRYPWLASVVKSRVFELFFAVIIVLNCVTMGFEAEQTAKGPASDASYYGLLVAEHSFTTLFTIELVLNLIVHGWRAFIPCLKGNNSSDKWWNFLDANLVIFTGILFSWVIPIMKAMFGFSGESGEVRLLTSLRAARLLRLVRVVQRVPALREVWLLLRGLTDSMRILFWTCVVIVTITYIFAVFGVVLIAKGLIERRETTDDEALKIELTELLEFVGGLDSLMYTLIQLLTLDSWNGIVRRLVKQITWCWCYFYAYIAVAVFVLMNLVTAIIVENAVTNSRQDEDHLIKAREKAKLEELKALEHLFVLMDSDGSGTLSWEEFKDAFNDPEMTKKWKLLDFDPDECKELFGLLDDGDGEIETTEFFAGLAQMKGAAQSKDLFRVRKLLDKLKDMLIEVGIGMRTKFGSSEAEALGQEESPLKRQTSKHSGLRACSIECPASVENSQEKEVNDEAHAKITCETQQQANSRAELQPATLQVDGQEAMHLGKVPISPRMVPNSFVMPPLGSTSAIPLKPNEEEMPVVVPPSALPNNPGYRMRM